MMLKELSKTLTRVSSEVKGVNRKIDKALHPERYPHPSYMAAPGFMFRDEGMDEWEASLIK